MVDCTHRGHGHQPQAASFFPLHLAPIRRRSCSDLGQLGDVEREASRNVTSALQPGQYDRLEEPVPIFAVAGVSEALNALLGILPRTLAFGQLLDRRLKALLGILACGYLKLLTVIVSDPHTVLVDPTVLDFANASWCHDVASLSHETAPGTGMLPLGQRFLGSNHIRRPRRVCRTMCG